MLAINGMTRTAFPLSLSLSLSFLRHVSVPVLSVARFEINIGNPAQFSENILNNINHGLDTHTRIPLPTFPYSYFSFALTNSRSFG